MAVSKAAGSKAVVSKAAGTKAADLKAPRGGVVRVAIPASASGNLAMMQKITANILGKLGCVACHSGFDIRFHHEDLNFKADLKGAITQGR